MTRGSCFIGLLRREGSDNSVGKSFAVLLAHHKDVIVFDSKASLVDNIL